MPCVASSLIRRDGTSRADMCGGGWSAMSMRIPPWAARIETMLWPSPPNCRVPIGSPPAIPAVAAASCTFTAAAVPTVKWAKAWAGDSRDAPDCCYCRGLPSFSLPRVGHSGEWLGIFSQQWIRNMTHAKIDVARFGWFLSLDNGAP